MRVSRRHVLGIGGGFLAGLALPSLAAVAAPVVDIGMRGDAQGAHVWFDPIGIRIEPGQMLRWTNRDAGNAHTATAYHPRIYERARRVPAGAEPWDSDFLLPDESFSMALTQEGVYDYYCIPHEHAGMVGRIVVGRPLDSGDRAGEHGDIPEAAQAAFPPVDEIMRKGVIHRIA